MPPNAKQLTLKLPVLTAIIDTIFPCPKLPTLGRETMISLEKNPVVELKPVISNTHGPAPTIDPIVPMAPESTPIDIGELTVALVVVVIIFASPAALT